MALSSTSTQLGCGRDIDQVWDHLDSPPDPHETTCPYCQAARADLARLGEATRTLRDANDTDPDLQVSPGVLDRVLAVAHAEVRRGRRLPLDQPGPERTSPNLISEQALTTVVRRVGDRTQQVQIRRCTLTPAGRDRTTPPAGSPDPTGPDPLDTPGGPLGTGTAGVAVSLRVSVAHDLSIPEASRLLRAAIIETVLREVGMDVLSVDIAVEDFHDA